MYFGSNRMSGKIPDAMVSMSSPQKMAFGTNLSGTALAMLNSFAMGHCSRRTKKRAQRLQTFWIRRLPSLENLFSSGFEGGNVGCPGTLAGMSQTLSGTESAIPSREPGASESCDSDRAIPRSWLSIDGLRLGLAILSRFSAILFYCDSTCFNASCCENSGDSWPAILGIVRFAIVCR